MEQLTLIEKIATGIALCLAVSWWIYFYQREDSHIHGFNEDFRGFIKEINMTDDLRTLAGFEYAVTVFRNEYKKTIHKQLVDDACGRLQAAIKNRKYYIINTITFLTEA
jgi:hypothetical protein